MRYIAPAGTKITFFNLFRALLNLIKSKDILEDFRNAICEKFNVKYCFFWGTGRTGMAFLLKSLYELDNKKRNEIIIPSYTCYSVPASIEYAGLKVRICDIDLQTMDFDYSKIMNQNFENVLAIISANLYGIPNNLEKLENLAKKHNIFFIDDAAQAMGAKFNKRYAGTFGDAGLFSLDKGKNITTLNGGIIVTNSTKIAKKLNEYQNHLQQNNLIQQIILILKIVIYSIFIKPLFYWIPNKLPFLKLGQTIYDSEMPLISFDKIQAAIGVELLKKLEIISNKRIINSSKLISMLDNINEITIPKFTSKSSPVYLRFPILVNRKDKQTIIEKLNSFNFGATGSYPESVYKINETQKHINHDYSNGESGNKLAQEVITLPTHEYVKEKDLMSMQSILKNYYIN